MIKNKISLLVCMFIMGQNCATIRATDPLSDLLSGSKSLAQSATIQHRLDLQSRASVRAPHDKSCSVCFKPFQGAPMSARALVARPNYAAFENCIHGSHFGCIHQLEKPECPECRAELSNLDQEVFGKALTKEKQIKIGNALQVQQHLIRGMTREGLELIEERDLLRAQLESERAARPQQDQADLAQREARVRSRERHQKNLLTLGVAGGAIGGAAAMFAVSRLVRAATPAPAPVVRTRYVVVDHGMFELLSSGSTSSK
jgi:hypothetical protein